MRVIAKPRLKEFWEKHSAAAKPLQAFWRTAVHAKWRNIHDVRKTYPHADAVTLACGLQLTVFNVGGNKFRLITGIVYRTHYVYIKAVLTHAEYTRGGWKALLCQGQ
jgi:mRNA interferase HigB